MKRIIQLLSDTDQSIQSYVWKAALISILPSLVIGGLVHLTMPDMEPTIDMPVVFFGLFALFVSPIIETLLMWPILILLKRFVQGTVYIALASALVWAIFHSLSAPTWGLVIAWPFFVFSLCFLAWEKKSKRHALVTTTLVHVCQNLIPSLALLGQ